MPGPTTEAHIETKTPLENGSVQVSKSLPILSPLNLRNRTLEIQVLVDSAFDRIKDEKSSGWGYYNGGFNYGMNLHIDELMLVKQVIRKGIIQGQNHFNIIDVGAGNFQWGDNVIEQLQKEFADSLIEVHVYSVRGECNDAKTLPQMGKYVHYKLGSFKIEDFAQELTRLNFPLIDNVDFIVSSFCLLHLMDPLGTVAQLLTVLKPKSGVMVSTGFDFNSDPKLGGKPTPMQKLFYIMRVPCVTILSESNIFILKRNTTTNCYIPFCYDDIAFQKNKTCIQYKMNHELFQKLTSDFNVERLDNPSLTMDNGYEMVCLTDERECFMQTGVPFLSQLDQYSDKLELKWQIEKDSIESRGLENVASVSDPARCLSSIRSSSLVPLDVRTGVELSSLPTSTVIFSNLKPGYPKPPEAYSLLFDLGLPAISSDLAGHEPIKLGRIL